MSEIGPVRRILEGFNIVGILVDDHPDANSRTARELYGTWELPSWWIVARGVEEGHALLSELLELLLGHRAHGKIDWNRMRSIVFIDRMLLSHAPSGDRPAGPLLDWESPRLDKKLPDWNELMEKCDRFSTVVNTLRAPNPAGNLTWDWSAQPEHAAPEGIPSWRTLLVFLTAYAPRGDRPQGASPSSHLPPIRWTHRARNPLFRVRTILELASRSALQGQPPPERALLRYGVDDTLDAHSSIYERVAQGNAILVTGRGMSDTGRAGGPGIPGNRILYAEAISWIHREIFERGRRVRASPDLGEAGWPSREIRDLILNTFSGEETPEDRLRELLRAEPGDAERISLQLSDLNMRNPLHRAFVDGVRVAVAEHDYSLTYQHWAAAHLPWRAVITTNFDHLHERAAGMVRRAEGSGAGQRTSEFNPQQYPVFPAEAARRIFKVYGGAHESMHAPLDEGFSKLELSEGTQKEVRPDALSARWASFREYVSKASTSSTGQERGESLLVVVGHSLQDPVLNGLLRDLDSKFSFRTVVWVDVKTGDLSRERGNIRNVFGAPKTLKLLEASALAFFHDLLERDLEARMRARARARR